MRIMGNVGKIGENRIIEQQGTVNNRTFVLLNFRSIILFSPIFPTYTRCFS